MVIRSGLVIMTVKVKHIALITVVNMKRDNQEQIHKGRGRMLNLIIGLVLGATLGVLLVSLLTVAKQADEREEHLWKDEDE